MSRRMLALALVALALVVLGAAFVAIATRPERAHAPEEVRAAFASAGIPLVDAEGLLPGC